MNSTPNPTPADSWQEMLLRWGLDAEGGLDRLRAAWARRFGHAPRLLAQAYTSYGTPALVTVQGRVLADPSLQPAEVDDSTWENLRAMLLRLESDEQPNLRVQVEFYGASAETLTDAEGYFAVEVSPAQPPDPAVPWHFAQVRVVGGGAGDPATAVTVLATAAAPVLIPPATAARGIISDIDDTILRSDVTDRLRSTRLMLLGNAKTRTAFPGVAAFYSALQAGASGCPGGEHNPIFYVSSSPWNIFDFLAQFMQVNGIPAGPITLRDYGLDEQTLAAFEHGAHKLAALRRILATYPHLPFLLVGDSGQQDPEIYAQAAREHPGRVGAIYIRDVTGEARAAGVRALANELRAAGVELLLVPDTAAAHAHAAARGWAAPPAGEGDRVRG